MRKCPDHFLPSSRPEEPPEKLTPDEAKEIYDMITRRFVAAFFYPVAEFDITTRTSTAAGHGFKTEGKVLAVPWLVGGLWQRCVERQYAEGTLPAISVPDGKPAQSCAQGSNPERRSHRARHPRYSEATLLAAMEGAGKICR